MNQLETLPNPPLEDCAVALKCANESPEVLERCLESIDDDVELAVVVTPNHRTIDFFRTRGISVEVTEYGNIAKSTQLSIDRADSDAVIVMDADTYFAPGSIRLLREGLQAHPVVKPIVHFTTGAGYIANVIAKHRKPFHDQTNYASNPGLTFRKSEMQEYAGGYIFNPKIRWTEDADLNYRLRRAGVPVERIDDAMLLHDDVTLSHELHAAFIYGVGKRLSLENTPGRPSDEDMKHIALAALRGIRPRNIVEHVSMVGADAYVLDLIWQGIYYAGYHAQKRTGRWSVQED